MNNLKRILFILIPLAVIAVIFVSIVAVRLMNTNKNSQIRYMNTPIATTDNNIKNPTKQNVTTQQTKKANTDTLNTGNNNPLSNWQDSDKIKHGEYTMPTTTPKATHPAQNIKTENKLNTEDTEHKQTKTINEMLDLWGWVPQIIQKKPEPANKTKIDTETVAIKEYANSLGLEIKKTVRTLGDQPQIMTDFIAGRGNVGNADALLNMSKKYKDLGVSLMHITASSTAPEDIKNNGYELGSAYKEVGVISKYMADAESTDDKKMLEVLYAYNKQIDQFSKEFVSFANIIGAYGVIFVKGEGGDIFTPPMQYGGTI